MDRASFELIGNVGKLEIKPIKDEKKLAIISLATSEKWKTESGDWTEKTYWHRVAVFAPNKVALIEKAVQMGTVSVWSDRYAPARGKMSADRSATRSNSSSPASAMSKSSHAARPNPRLRLKSLRLAKRLARPSASAPRDAPDRPRLRPVLARPSSFLRKHSCNPINPLCRGPAAGLGRLRRPASRFCRPLQTWWR
jgi:hypothetical protein